MITEPNDTILGANESGLDSSRPGTLSFSAESFIGDNPNVFSADDVDLIELRLDPGDQITIDIDADEFGSTLDSVLRLFNSSGQEIALSDDDSAPGEEFTFDSFIEFTASASDTYYVGISSYSNFSYDPFVEGSGVGESTGDYEIEIIANFLSVINGSSSNDFLIGTSTKDAIKGFAGDDILQGNDGNDTLRGNESDDTIQGGNGDDLLTGNSENDLLVGDAGFDTLRGGSGSDSAQGGLGDDVIFGGTDEDMLLGSEGNDILRGGLSVDTLRGDTGNDRLEGGDGDDFLIGGDGADRFVLDITQGSDSIVDFQEGADRFVLTQGFTFSDLDIVPILSDTQIRVGDILLATVFETSSSAIGAEDFIV